MSAAEAEQAEGDMHDEDAPGHVEQAQGDAPETVEQADVPEWVAPADDGDVPERVMPADDGDVPELARTVEALLFLSADPLTTAELAEAAQVGEGAILAAVALLGEEYAPGRRGIVLRELAGGYTLASDPDSEEAARRLFSRPRVATLTPAQAETLAIVAYLQPVSRPEIARIRGVSADSAVGTLLERALIEEAGHSQFGATLYRTTTQFLKLFGLRDLDELPDVARWDPSPEEQAELRERLLRAGDARSPQGSAPPSEQAAPEHAEVD